ncbi:hypothetical protein Dimus_009376 [Dionaea muscipula]
MVGARRGRPPKHRASAVVVVKSGVKEGVKDTPGGLRHDKLREDFGEEKKGAQSSVRAGSVSASKSRLLCREGAGRDALVDSRVVDPPKTSMRGLDKGKEMMGGRWVPVKKGGRPCQMQEDRGVVEVSISSCFEVLQVCGEVEITHPSDDREQIGCVDNRDCHEGVLGGYRSPEVNGAHDSRLLEWLGLARDCCGGGKGMVLSAES